MLDSCLVYCVPATFVTVVQKMLNSMEFLPEDYFFVFGHMDLCYVRTLAYITLCGVPSEPASGTISCPTLIVVAPGAPEPPDFEPWQMSHFLPVVINFPTALSKRCQCVELWQVFCRFNCNFYHFEHIQTSTARIICVFQWTTFQNWILAKKFPPEEIFLNIFLKAC